MLSIHCVNGLVEQCKFILLGKVIELLYSIYVICIVNCILNYESLLLSYARGKFIPKHGCIIVFLISELIPGIKQSGL